MVKVAVPCDLSWESRRGRRVPISLKSLGSFKVTSAGASSFAARRAKSPKRPLLPLAAWARTPLSTAISPAGTCQASAAAATSMARAMAPASRICR